MKTKLLVTSLILSVFLYASISPAATLAVHVSGKFEKADYLCIYEVGCFNLKIASHGQNFNVGHVDFTHLKRMALLNVYTKAISSTEVQPSCSAVVADKNQTVSVNVQVVNDKKSSASVIQKVSCTVS